MAATVLGGAALAGDGTSGCFLPGPVDGPVAAEACESDGTLTGYHAALGLIHNISRDHGEVDALLPQFEAFAKRSGRLLVNSASPEAAALGRAVRRAQLRRGPDADTPLEVTSTGPDRAVGSSTCRRGSLALDVPQPGPPQPGERGGRGPGRARAGHRPARRWRRCSPASRAWRAASR